MICGVSWKWKNSSLASARKWSSIRARKKLKAQFEGVVRSFVPMHSIVRIDEVERLGTPKISEARGAVGNVMPFPMPMPEK
nr:hypothetical protein GCM10020185_44470 [Pseudomonas brassicacearum subsp. brassicacearum]